jgi:hypothetical protein
MIFFCVACLRPSKTRIGTFGREGANCNSCNSTSRDRAMLLNIHWAFLRKLFMNPRSVPKIIGVSDGQLIERILKTIYRSNYQNYQYHQEPKLDITQVSPNLYATADIISCTEVLEHVAPPVNLAFFGLWNLLKKNGTLILSVPHSDSGGTHVEHFPEMDNVELILEDKPRLIGTLKNGNQTEFTELIFHGGIGSTLEYRIFSKASLCSYLDLAKFHGYFESKNYKLLGISWEPWSRVWVCKKLF